MPKRTDIKSVLIIGAGPIIIGQACEFDYSGAQACKALREEGYRVILVNSNPATIMTDPQTADVTYIEPITWEVVERIIAKERPDAILPTMGGQTALNCAMDLARHGVLDKYDIELIGAKPDAIDKAEDRERFKEAMDRIGLESARSGVAYSLREAKELQAKFGFPTVIRPSFTLGGSGGGICDDAEALNQIAHNGLQASPIHQILVEKCISGWKEIEFEVIRDAKGNASVWVIDAENKIATRKITASRSIGTSWPIRRASRPATASSSRVSSAPAPAPPFRPRRPTPPRCSTRRASPSTNTD